MSGTADDFKRDLRRLGVSRSAINAVWPTWWSDEAEGSKSAQVELRFAVARRLGLSPKSLIGGGEPTFVWQHEAKFKGLSTYDSTDESALTSFGIMLARYLLRAVTPPSQNQLSDFSAAELRSAILKNSDNVSLQDLCATCWGLGIPVIHLRVFPLATKKMVAMIVQSDYRPAILIGKDASYPAPTAYHLAHEMGHIAYRHLDKTKAVIDLDEPIEMTERDQDEQEADAYAMELLTGMSEPMIEMNAAAKNGTELASAVASAAHKRRIEPGTLALCYGHQSGNWRVTYAALSKIYAQKHEVWKFLNKFASQELEFDALDEETEAYIKAVLGAADLA